MDNQTLTEHAPRILTLRIPNPFFEGRNRVYVILSDPVTLIDSGTATDRAFDALVEALGEHQLTVADIGRVALTHKHIDHIGNAWRIQQASRAEILIHDSEMMSVSDVDPAGGRYHNLALQRLEEWNAPSQALHNDENASRMDWKIRPASPTGLHDGDRIDLGDGELEVIHTPGHTVGSICLRYGSVLFSGDHVLPDITPNIGGGDMRQNGLLELFMDSLQRTITIGPDIERVLPGHGDSFGDLEDRCRRLLDHHRLRLETTESILRERGPQQVYQMAQHLFGDMTDFHLLLGCAEAHAHLEYLTTEGRIGCDQGTYFAA